MKTDKQEVRTTLVFGLLAALFYIPGNMALQPIFGYKALPLIMWAFLAAYSLLLVRWTEQKATVIFFPLLLNLLISFWLYSPFALVAVSLVTLSWIRSGICFPAQPIRKVIIELITCGGAAFLVASFAPHTQPSMALGVWMFFLIQAGYFILAGIDSPNKTGVKIDHYEQARHQAESIISS